MATIPATELINWTPVALHLDAPEPSIEWQDLGRVRFEEPFFDETVLRWKAANPQARTLRTGVDALFVLDQAPSLNPSGFIFHLSRCGSTLLARLMQQIPGCTVVSEPAIINHLLQMNGTNVDRATQARLLRLLIRALGRQRFVDERHYILKLSSWNIRKLEVFRSAFPRTPLVWLQRKPAEVMASLLAHEPEWRALQGAPEKAASLFEMTAGEVATSTLEAFYAGALASLLRAASSPMPSDILTVDYSELPQAAWTTVAPYFGLKLNAGEIGLMEAQSRFYSKNAKLTMFERSEVEKNALPRLIRQLVDAELDSLYRELRGRKASKPSLRQSAV